MEETAESDGPGAALDSVLSENLLEENLTGTDNSHQLPSTLCDCCCFSVRCGGAEWQKLEEDGTELSTMLVMQWAGVSYPGISRWMRKLAWMFTDQGV